ncbi:MAG TPA: MBL fold metallo-hydrolase [Polyangia bacterium]|nr:MBL fold metallo-hydrolase [Polyangia bacterium]
MLAESTLSPRLLVFTLGGDTPLTSYGANCVALASAAGTLLVDPLIAPAHAAQVAAAIARRGFPPVTHVVVTHHHTDHALGAGWFAARGATVIAHERCAAAMAASHPAIVAERRASPGLSALFADAEPHTPARTFADSLHVDLGDVGVEARYLGPGHTVGDCVVLFPSEDAVACGDLIVSGYHFNYEESDLPALPRALDAVRALPASHFIPGHGRPGGRELVDAQARYHADAQRTVASARSRADARVAIRGQFPGFELPLAIETALDRWPSGWEKT